MSLAFPCRTTITAAEVIVQPPSTSGSNPGGQVFVTEGTVEKHVRAILTKLDLPESETEHRRVPAVLRFLETR